MYFPPTVTMLFGKCRNVCAQAPYENNPCV